MLGRGNQEMPSPDELAEAGVHKSYTRWLQGRPPAGEAFVDTGEASPVDVQKILWSPNRDERAALRAGMAADVARVNQLFAEGRSHAYATHMTTLVGQFLEELGVDPESLEIMQHEQAVEPVTE